MLSHEVLVYVNLRNMRCSVELKEDPASDYFRRNIQNPAITANRVVVFRTSIVKRYAAHIMGQAHRFAVDKIFHKVIRPLIYKFPSIIQSDHAD